MLNVTDLRHTKKWSSVLQQVQLTTQPQLSVSDVHLRLVFLRVGSMFCGTVQERCDIYYIYRKTVLIWNNYSYMYCICGLKISTVYTIVQCHTSTWNLSIKWSDQADDVITGILCRVVSVESRIDVLMNNAGVAVLPQTKSTDGFEMQFATNVLGSWTQSQQTWEVVSQDDKCLFRSLLAYEPPRRPRDRCCARKQSRKPHFDRSRDGESRKLGAKPDVWQTLCFRFMFQGKKDIQWDDLMFEKSYNGWEVYCHSKLANILFNLELSKRLKSTRHLYPV